MMTLRTKSIRTHIVFVFVAIATFGSDTLTAQPPEGGRRGGDRGFRGGPPGGFDPTFILQRMDRNGNGRLDPDEVDGRAKSMLERFAPGLDMSRSMSFDDIRKKVQAARENRDRAGGRRGREGSDRSNRGGDRGGGEQQKIEIEPLVPGFGELVELDPVAGFGGSGAFFAVVPTEADEAEAKRTLGRYDRNKDGRLDREETRRGRWSDDPTVYDQNGDGALSKRELSVRYAKRRLAKDEENSQRDRERQSNRDRRDRDRDGNRDRKEKKEDNEDERKSYRFLTASERLPQGIPDWFREKDSDQDGQVGMGEYAVEWDDETVAEFTGLDSDANGLVSPSEALQSSGTSSESDSDSGSGGSKSNVSDKDIPEKYMNYAKSYIKKYDKNDDSVLSKDEIKSMRRPPKNADPNGDGKITVKEFARSVMR